MQVVARRVDDATQQLVEAEPRRQRALGREALGEDREALAVACTQAVEEAVVAARGTSIARAQAVEEAVVAAGTSVARAQAAR